MYTKTAYDVVNRPVGSYTGYAPSGDTHPWEITDEDKIFVQTLTALDGAGNATQIANFHRNNGDTSTGPLTADTPERLTPPSGKTVPAGKSPPPITAPTADGSNSAACRACRFR